MVPFRGCSTDSQRFWTTPYSSLHIFHGFPVLHFIAKPHKTISSTKHKLCVKFNWMQVTASHWLGYFRVETIYRQLSPCRHLAITDGRCYRQNPDLWWKLQCRGLTGNNYRFYQLLLLRNYGHFRDTKMTVRRVQEMEGKITVFDWGSKTTFGSSYREVRETEGWRNGDSTVYIMNVIPFKTYLEFPAASKTTAMQKATHWLRPTCMCFLTSRRQSCNVSQSQIMLRLPNHRS